MAKKYKLHGEEGYVQNMETMAVIPNEPANVDWQKYQAWLAEGNTPIPLPPSPYYNLVDDEWVYDPVAEAVAVAYEQKHIDAKEQLTLNDLADKTYAQVETYIDNNVTDLASQIAFDKKITKIILAMLKRMDLSE